MANLQGYSSNVLYNNFMEEGFMISSGYVHEPSFPDPVAVNVGVHALISLSVKKEIFTKPTFQVYKMPCRENAELMILNGTLCLFLLSLVERCQPRQQNLWLTQAINVVYRTYRLHHRL